MDNWVEKENAARGGTRGRKIISGMDGRKGEPWRELEPQIRRLGVQFLLMPTFK